MGSQRARATASPRGRDAQRRTGPGSTAGRASSSGRAAIAQLAPDPRQLGTPAEGPDLFLGLQRTAGNAAVVAALARPPLALQRKGKKPAPKKPEWEQSTRPQLALGDGPNSEIGQLQQALNRAVPEGAALRVTAMFDAATETKLRAFQKAHPPMPVTGVADKRTWWSLDKAAPQDTRQGRIVVASGPGAALGTPDQDTKHPTIKLGAKGPAVEELQKKLNTLPVKDIQIYLSEHGKFDKTTKIGVTQFQQSRKPALPATGVVGRATWAALDAIAGPVNVGREEYDWTQRAEGTITGTKTAYTWRLLADRLQVTINIKFTGASKDPMVNQWRQDISTIWNAFKFVDPAGPGKPAKSLLLDFVVGSGSPADATIVVHKTPKNAKTVPRSDAGNYYTGDKDPGLAPHEFGHLLGLQDEYNKGPEQYTVVTGEQPAIGEFLNKTDKKGNVVSPETIATEMRKAVEGNAATRGKRAAAVVKKYDLHQGAFAQRVALAYEKANAGKLLREDFNTTKGFFNVKDPAGTMGNDLAARIPGRFDDAPDESDAVSPFLYDNRGIMGDMSTVPGAAKADAHNHPVAERHVREFLELLRRNRPGNWKLERR
jgi:peptidoglycan hydrolase-like protein with peptidoglycan-binding domain